MDVHLRDLRSFLAVAERLSFTAAAADLFVSQPALSRQIRSLEADLRVRLFDRDRRSVRLTSAGEALVPHARAVLAEWDRAQAALASAAAAGAATLVVGMSTGIGRGLLPALRARLSARHPEVDVRMRLVPWTDPTGGLAARGPEATDVALVWVPLPDPEPTSGSRSLSRTGGSRSPRVTASRSGARSPSPTSPTSRSWPSRRRRVCCASTGSPSSTAAGAH